MGRVFHQVFLPRGQGFGELLLELAAAAQEIAGLGHFNALPVAIQREKRFQAGDGLLVAAAVDVAAGDVQVRAGGLLIARKPFQEPLQSGYAEAELPVVLWLGNLPGS